MKKINKKIHLLLAIVLIFSTVVVSCSSNKTQLNTQQPQTPAPAKPNEKVRIVLDWTPNTNHTGLFVAQEKGYFAKQGIDIEIMQPPEGGAEALVAGGKAEFGISFQDMLSSNFANEKPMPIIAVAAVIQHNTSGIISLKEKNIDSPKKMAGHTYATWDWPIEQAIVKKIVEDDGGKFENIKLIPNSVTDVVTALKTDVDTVWVYYAWDGIATQVKGLETNYLNFADFGKELDYYSPVIITNQDYAKKNSETVKKALQAIKEGYEYAISNPEDAANILLKAAPELDKEIVMKSQQWLAKQYKAEEKRWGYIDKNRWDLFFKWLFDNKLIEKQIPSGVGFTNEYLPN